MTPVIALEWLGVLAAALTVFGLTVSGVAGYRERRQVQRAILAAQEAMKPVARKDETLAEVRRKRAEN